MANWIQRFLTAIATHKADADAHHAPFTQADISDLPLTQLESAVCSETEADTKITTHKGDASAHHAKTTDAGDITSGRFGKTRLEWTANKLLKGAGAGADPTEIDVPAAGPTIVRKTADETVNNSTTSQNDDHLLFAMGANEIWAFLAFLIATYGKSDGIKLLWSVPTGAVKYHSLVQVPSSTHDATDVQSAAFSTAVIAKQETNPKKVIPCYSGIIINGANAGNAQLQWAQRTATAVDTKIHANSCIIAFKIA